MAIARRAARADPLGGRLRIGQEGQVGAAILDSQVGQGLAAREHGPEQEALGLRAIGAPGVAAHGRMHAQPGVDGHQVVLGRNAGIDAGRRTVVALPAVQRGRQQQRFEWRHRRCRRTQARQFGGRGGAAWHQRGGGNRADIVGLIGQPGLDAPGGMVADAPRMAVPARSLVGDHRLQRAKRGPARLDQPLGDGRREPASYGVVTRGAGNQLGFERVEHAQQLAAMVLARGGALLGRRAEQAQPGALGDGRLPVGTGFQPLDAARQLGFDPADGGAGHAQVQPGLQIAVGQPGEVDPLEVTAIESEVMRAKQPLRGNGRALPATDGSTFRVRQGAMRTSRRRAR
ncbi:hypothetical protein D3C86_1295290 [compost metagenome]